MERIDRRDRDSWRVNSRLGTGLRETGEQIGVSDKNIEFQARFKVNQVERGSLRDRLFNCGHSIACCARALRACA